MNAKDEETDNGMVYLSLRVHTEGIVATSVIRRVRRRGARVTIVDIGRNKTRVNEGVLAGAGEAGPAGVEGARVGRAVHTWDFIAVAVCFGGAALPLGWVPLGITDV